MLILILLLFFYPEKILPIFRYRNTYKLQVPNKTMKQLVCKKNYLETEKIDFLTILYTFIKNISFEEFEGQQFYGRPKANLSDIIKCLLIMNYHSWSYRRSCSDFELLKEQGILENIPKRATLNKYMNEPIMIKILERLIEISSLCFIDVEDTLLLDSTQFFPGVIMNAEKRKKHQKKKSMLQVPNLGKTRKLHISACKDSKIICCARTTVGKVHDHKTSQELIEVPVKNGFRIKKLLADAGYNSRENFCLCEDLGIRAFLDFRKNTRDRRHGTTLRKKQFILYSEYKEKWNESYRYRVIVELIFSSIKNRCRNYLRSRNEISKDCEMLLKALWYNLCIIAKHVDNK